MGLTPREDLREGISAYRGRHRCRPAFGRFKIVRQNTSPAEALMSAAARFILVVSALSVAAYMTQSETGTVPTGPPDQAQREGWGNPTSSIKSEFSQPQDPALIEPTVVTVVKHPAGHAASQPAGTRKREAIAGELQQGVRRVGCYEGELNGAWTRSTQQAMKAFADRVNAKLPVDKPDNILLALVQGYPNKVCGTPCPSGHSLNRTQEGTQTALLARNNEKRLAAGAGQSSAHVTSAWTVTTTGAEGAPVSPAGSEQPGDVAPAKVTAASGDAHHQKPASHREKRWQSPTRHQGTWASNFFKQRDRLSLN